MSIKKATPKYIYFIDHSTGTVKRSIKGPSKSQKAATKKALSKIVII
jgi:hypothetical protein